MGTAGASRRSAILHHDRGTFLRSPQSAGYRFEADCLPVEHDGDKRKLVVLSCIECHSNKLCFVVFREVESLLPGIADSVAAACRILHFRVEEVVCDMTSNN
jgi:hypothetical protein